MFRILSKDWPSEEKKCKLTAAHEHPLLFVKYSIDESFDSTTTKSKTKENDSGTKQQSANNRDSKIVVTSWNGLDPLSAALSNFDKLTVDVETKPATFGQKVEKVSYYIGEDFMSWISQKSKILNKFSNTEKLLIRSSFLSFEKNVSNIPQKVKNRLEQLDEIEEGNFNDTMNLSQQDYAKRMEELNANLVEAWNTDQRVKALKIAIQSTKQLSAINVIFYYPSKFVLITDILDSFGRLVYERIRQKIDDPHEDIHFAHETCRNWFYKISSIRELLPRFYIETAILKIYSFLIDRSHQEKEFEQIFHRLTRMIRGVGDPLVAIYCRVYLCRVAIEICPERKSIFQANIYDIIDSIDLMTSSLVQSTIINQKVNYPLYYSLFAPALEWLLGCLLYKCNDSVIDQLMSYYRDRIVSSNPQHDCLAMVLNAIIVTCPATVLVQRLRLFQALVGHFFIEPDDSSSNSSATTTTGYPTYLLIKNIGESLNSLETQDNEQMTTVRAIWKITGRLKSKPEYTYCLEAWSDLIGRYFTIEQINKIFGDVITILSPSRQFETYQTQLLTIWSNIVRSASARGSFADRLVFFSMSNLMPYMDMFSNDSCKVEACKSLVEVFVKCFPGDIESDEDMTSATNTSDPVILNSISYYCKSMHDSINALTLDDDRRQISNLIIGYINRVNYHRDFEAQLAFYVDCRASFYNLDHVLHFLVHQVNRLAIETHQIVKGYHTKKTISFVAACLAYNYITIPSIEEMPMRLQLYLASSKVALINVCLPQTDAFLKAAITLLRTLPSQYEAPDGKVYSNDPFFYSFASQLMSTLLVVPDNPENEMLYLFKGLYNVVKLYQFDIHSNCKFMILSNMLQYLSTAARASYPYHVDRGKLGLFVYINLLSLFCFVLIQSTPMIHFMLKRRSL